MLSEERIRDIYRTSLEEDSETGLDALSPLKFARAVEAATYAELLAGVEVSDPNWIEIDSAGRKGVLYYYTAYQYRNGIAAARAERNDQTCEWSEDEDGVWHSDCGEAWTFTDGGTPSEHGCRFCHSCGKPTKTFLGTPDDEWSPPSADAIREGGEA